MVNIFSNGVKDFASYVSSNNSSPDKGPNPKILGSVIKLLTLIIKEDETITEKEEKIVDDYFRTYNNSEFTEEDIVFIHELLKKSLADNKLKSYKEYCILLLELKTSYEFRLGLLTVLFQIAYAHEGIVYTELSLLRNIARFLLIKKADRVELEEKYGIKEEKEQPTYTTYSNRDEIISNAYSMLELEKTAKKEDIKKAYRRMALIYHPDRLPSDATQEDIEKAEEKFRQINEAYKCLKLERNIS